MGQGQKGPHCGFSIEQGWTEPVVEMRQLLSSLETSVILSQLLICCSLSSDLESRTAWLSLCAFSSIRAPLHISLFLQLRALR